MAHWEGPIPSPGPARLGKDRAVSRAESHTGHSQCTGPGGALKVLLDCGGQRAWNKALLGSENKKEPQRPKRIRLS